METKVFNAVMAMSMMDDALVSEAAAPVSSKKRAVRGSRVLRYALAAAAALILTAGGIFAYFKLPRDENGRFAFLPPKATEIMTTNAPMATAGPEATRDAEPTVVNAPPETTSEPDPVVSGEPTEYETPEATGAQTPSPMPPSTPGPTPTPSPTYMPTAEPTAQTTAVPSAEPTQTAEPTLLPEPTGMPAVPYLEYYSFEAFVNAVHDHADPLLEGIDRRYEAPYLPGGSRLTKIRVDMDEVDYTYALPSGGSFEYSWTRSGSVSQTYYYDIINGNDGTWHGDLFVYLSQAGKYYAVRLDDGYLLRMRCTANCTENEMTEYCRLVRYAI